MEKLFYNGIELDSKEELHIAWYLDELKEAGYIDSWGRSASYTLFPKREYQGAIVREHIYTPDFYAEWKNSAIGIFVGEGCPFVDHIPYSIIEVKPAYDANNMTRLFKLNQKWVLDKIGAYVHLVIPEKLFRSTFAPQRYLLTDKGKGVRKISVPYLNLNEYIQRSSEKVHRKRVQKPGKR